MRRAAVIAALVLAFAAGTARAGGTWVVVSSGAPTGFASGVPSASTPSLSGALPLGWTSPPAAPEQMSYGQLLSVWQRAGAAYGIPWQVLAAINKVESNFGRNMGPSSAGAIGWMQFMPSTWLRWGTDANGDGIADPWNATDAVYSAARYLAAAGGTQDISRAVFAYNHADWYVNEVLQLAGLFQNAGADETFTLDRLQVSLEQAQSAVAAASDELVTARQDEQTFAQQRDALFAHAQSAHLLSRRLELERLATHADVAAGDAHRRVERASEALTSAQHDLALARERARTASFAQGTSSLLDTAVYDGGYAFPVGGGPSVVSAGHSHHDYPAVDIAAPEGSPAYALEDGTVLRSWTYPDPRCGIGLTWQGDDGMNWTYCHLSWLDPSVTPGARLSTGELVGLVGHTGDASGPHLHLQANPQTVWPQRLAWFQGFAGSAFRWQDGPTLDSGPVFAVVEDAQTVGFTP
jgi:murein DD-endopeptidase MepM/ murein hydrolase activator NlpD